MPVPPNPALMTTIPAPWLEGDEATGECQMLDVPDGTLCEDGNDCTDEDQCVSGECISEVDTVCDDANPCTDDGCNPKGGCTFFPNQEFCDDGSLCTANDQCLQGQCKGEVLECDDGNACTNDGCDPESGCVHVPVDVPCEDGNPCTLNDQCIDGQCQNGPKDVMTMMCVQTNSATWTPEIAATATMRSPVRTEIFARKWIPARVESVRERPWIATTGMPAPTTVVHRKSGVPTRPSPISLAMMAMPAPAKMHAKKVHARWGTWPVTTVIPVPLTGVIRVRMHLREQHRRLRGRERLQCRRYLCEWGMRGRRGLTATMETSVRMMPVMRIPGVCPSTTRWPVMMTMPAPQATLEMVCSGVDTRRRL